MMPKIFLVSGKEFTESSSSKRKLLCLLPQKQNSYIDQDGIWCSKLWKAFLLSFWCLKFFLRAYKYAESLYNINTEALERGSSSIILTK